MTDFWPQGSVRNGMIVAAGSLLLLAGNAVLAIGLAPPSAVIVLLATVASAWLVVRMCRPTAAAPWAGPGTFSGAGSWLAQPVEGPKLAVCLVLAAGLCVLGGEGHLFFANEDWLLRDAVLGDLVRQPFPLTYLHEDKTYMLRAPLGMYLLPAAVGKVLGMGGAYAALVAQNATVLGLFFYLFAQSVGIPAAWSLGLFIAFGRLNVIPCLLVAYLKTGTLWLPQHLESIFPGLQYMSPVTQIFWAPNHALPGWWLTAVLILCVRGQLPLPMLPILLAGLCLWSPLPMIGAFAMAGVVLLPKASDLLRSRPWWTACAVAAGFIPVLLYLVTDAGSIPQGFNTRDDGHFAFAVTLFFIFFVPHLLIVRVGWAHVATDLKRLMIVAVIILLVLPFFRMGPNNDLMMRASIVPLALLALVFGSCAIAFFAQKRAILAAVTVVLIVGGAVTPLVEIVRALAVRSFAISTCNVLSAWSQSDPDRWMAHYMVNVDRVPGWLVRPAINRRALGLDRIICWPDHPQDVPFDLLAPQNVFPPQRQALLP